MTRKLTRTDRWLVGSCLGLAVVLVAVITIVAPAGQDNDPRPTVDNAGSFGAKAIFQTLRAMGVPAERWEKPLGDLPAADASHTTLLLADPAVPPTSAADLQRELASFLDHGGRVLATGPGGALLLGGAAAPSGNFRTPLCQTVPEGPGALAAAGSVEMRTSWQWNKPGVRYRVEQRCGNDAVVVRFAAAHGGEAVWWAAATPLTNSGLKSDANLRLLLASLGPDLGSGRRVLFDEGLRSQRDSLWDYASGLPLGWISMQTATIVGMILFTYSRRRGPLRMPVALPRSSPLEFAESMGDLYAKAGAHMAAIDAARRRLERLLLRGAGLQPSVLKESPEAVREALTARLGGDWSDLAQHLREAAEAADRKLTDRSTLAIVRALHDDEVRIHRLLHPEAVKPAADGEEEPANELAAP